MRTILLALALSLPLAASAAAPAKKGAKPPVKPVPTASPAPAPAELDEATAARRDEVLEKAKRQADMAEFLEARTLYREALALDPANASAKSGLAGVEAECAQNAKRQISEAKAYEAAFNYAEALRSLDLALKYADSDKSPERQQALEIQKRIKRATER